MKRLARLVLIGLLGSCASSGRPPPPPPPVRIALAEVTFRGRVLGHDGAPLPMAHVQVGHRGHEVAADGRFALTLPGGKLLKVNLRGVDHADNRLAIWTGEGDLELEVRLGTHGAPEEESIPEVVLVEMVEGRTEPLRSLPMVADEAGGFRAEITDPPSPLLYQLKGVTPWRGQTINGSQADRFLPDGGGDYVSVIENPGATFVLQHRPRPAAEAGLAPVTDKAELGKTARSVWETVEAIDRLIGKLTAKGKDPAEQVEHLDAFRIALQARLAKSPPGLARKMMLAAYLEADASHPWGQPRGEGSEADERWMALARETLSPDFPGWTFMSRGLSKMGELFDRAYADRVIAWHSDLELAGSIAERQAIDARFQGRTSRQRRLYRELGGRLARTRAGRRVAAAPGTFDPDRTLSVGDPVPGFDLPDLAREGERLTPTTYAGSYLLIDLWAIWCSPCVAEIPKLRELQEKLGGKGLRILSISTTDSPEAIRKFHRKNAMPWDNAAPGERVGRKVQSDFGVVGIPAYFLVGPEGKLLLTGPVLRIDLIGSVAKAMGVELGPDGKKEAGH